MNNIILQGLTLEQLQTFIKDAVNDAVGQVKAPAHQNADQDELLTVVQAASFLKLAVPTIYSKVSLGELPVMKRGKRLYFSSTELLDYLKDGRKKTNSEIEAEAQAYLRTKNK